MSPGTSIIALLVPVFFRFFFLPLHIVFQLLINADRRRMHFFNFFWYYYSLLARRKTIIFETLWFFDIVLIYSYTIRFQYQFPNIPTKDHIIHFPILFLLLTRMLFFIVTLYLVFLFLCDLWVGVFWECESNRQENQ